MTDEYRPQPWMKYVLVAAGAYNLLWGAAAILLPERTLAWLGIESSPTAAAFWQCIGMIVGVYGVGYLIASRSPFRHWPITLVGLLGKVFGPIGFLLAVRSEALPASLGWTLFTNDLIWWAPFIVILWSALRSHQAVGSAYEMPESDDPVRDLTANTGDRLTNLAEQQPQLIVFLRHAGCTFCREAMADLSAQRQQIEAAGCGIVLVHLSEEDNPEFFQQYGLDDVPRIADPACRLYRQFGLDLGGFSQLFGLKVWIRGVIAGLLGGHGIGRSQGNTFQMPGVFLYSCGQVLDGYLHNQASDRPRYVELVERNLAPTSVAVAG